MEAQVFHSPLTNLMAQCADIMGKNGRLDLSQHYTPVEAFEEEPLIVLDE